MKKLVTLVCMVTILLLNGCNDKEKEGKGTEDELMMQGDKTSGVHNDEPSYHFSLKDLNQKSYVATLKGKDFMLEDTNASLVMIHFFATWCPPCTGEIAYLNDLQEKYPQELFITGILINDTSTTRALEQYIQKNGIRYYVSAVKDNNILAKKLVQNLNMDENFSLPLTVLYQNGKYLVHYEGAVPIEMLDHDIQEALKNNTYE
ncbi:MAG: TlpA family protein disulfide reductase [Campylobacterales bacterium]|nr:TlpA family protein disulfide reductase [Campylobacterales bacterium]